MFYVKYMMSLKGSFTLKQLIHTIKLIIQITNQRIIIYGTYAEYQSDSWTINNKPTIELYKTLMAIQIYLI